MTRPLLLSLLLLAALAALVPSAWGASLQYTLPGTQVVFADTGGTVTFTQSNKATNTGQISAQYDKGAGAQPSLWEMRCFLSFTGTLTAGQVASYYIATADTNAATNVDGTLAITNTALTAVDKLRNLLPVGNLLIDQTVQNTTMVASFRNIYLPQRYFSIVMWNFTSISTETSTTKHKCIMTPVPPQMQ
jgi:hypothetical protein